MEEGVPASFLDLILSALAGIVILTTISPQFAPKQYARLEVEFTNLPSKMICFVELESEDGTIYNTSGRNDFDKLLSTISKDRVVVDIELDAEIESLDLTLSIFDDEISFKNSDKFNVKLIFKGKHESFILHKNNYFTEITSLEL